MKYFLFSLSIFSLILITGCREEPTAVNENADGFSMYKWDVPKEVKDQLLAVRAATARYHNIEHAIADGYEDINVVIPQMGHHYLKMDLMDGVFELTKPEILVYSEMPNGKFKLVAVEYGVPLNIAPNPPEGFIGSYDVWTENTGAGIWALHAWIWKDNPNGVFASFNPLVP